jgi:hypothetical protein
MGRWRATETWLEQWRIERTPYHHALLPLPVGLAPHVFCELVDDAAHENQFRLANRGFKGPGIALSGLREEPIQPRGVARDRIVLSPWCRPRA